MSGELPTKERDRILAQADEMFAERKPRDQVLKELEDDYREAMNRAMDLDIQAAVVDRQIKRQRQDVDAVQAQRDAQWRQQVNPELTRIASERAEGRQADETTYMELATQASRLDLEQATIHQRVSKLEATRRELGELRRQQHTAAEQALVTLADYAVTSCTDPAWTKPT